MANSRSAASDREPHEVIAECIECNWDFQEHDYKTYRVDKTDSRIDVSGRQVAHHSRITGHAVRFKQPDTRKEKQDTNDSE